MRLNQEKKLKTRRENRTPNESLRDRTGQVWKKTNFNIIWRSVFAFLPQKYNLRKVFILILIFAWIFSGWPRIWQNPPIPPKVKEAEAAWWGSGWDYKKPVDVTYSGSALSDFQILVTTDTESLITDGKMQSDCADIRMIDSGEEEGDELDYWIESGTCNTTSTRIWVEVSSITGDKTIYMYYGNGSASNASNGPDTFVYFNNFETEVGFDAGDLNPTRSTDAAKYDSYGIYGEGGGNYQQETRSGIDSGRDLVWETWVRGKSSSSNCSLSGIGIGHPGGGTDKNGYQAYIDERNEVAIRLDFDHGQVICSDTPTINWDTWYFVSFYWTSNDELGMSVYSDPSSSPIGSCSTTHTTYTDGEYGVAAYKNADWDDYRVRKYAETEPTTEVGSEIEFTSVTVSSFGNQTTNLDIPSSNQYVGGGFSLVDNTGSRNVTGISITEYGTVDAQTNLNNTKLYYDLDTTDPYDCASESYGGDETQFGSATGFNGADGIASFTDSVEISTTTTMCVYVVLDVESGAGDEETLKIKIDNPSTEVTVSSGTVSPDSAVEIDGTTTLLTLPDLQQIHYRWRNDDSGESGTWWDSNWDYRKKVTIAGGTGAGNDYQAKLMVGESSGASGYEFHLESHVQSDFNDLRFIDDDDTTQLDYWIENTTGTSPNQTATVWVEVKDDLDSDQDIYVYYGNSSAGAGSDGSSTFMFFDDFEDGNADGWIEHNGTWSVVDFDGSYRYYQSDDTTTYLRTSNGEADWTDYILETKIRIASGGSTGGFAAVLFRFQDTDNHYAVILDDRPDDSIWIRKWVGGSYSGSEWSDVAFDRDSWYDLRVDVFDEGSDHKIKAYFEGITHETTFTDFASGEIALMMHGTQAYYDDIRVRKYASSEPSYLSSESEETPEAGAAWAADEDTELTDLAAGTIRRLRIEVSNEGGQTASDIQYRLEVSEPNPSDCATASYERVSTDDDWEMADSSYITDGEETFNVDPGLTDENTTFVSGELKDTGDLTSGITLTETQFTEIEYSIRATSYASAGATYCFRFYDATAGALLDNYAVYPEATVANSAPEVSNVVLNGGDPIDLTEGTTTSVPITATITDPNGCEDVFSNGTITARVYRSGVGDSCTADDNNCYVDVTLTEDGDTCSGAGDTTGDAVGSVNIQFHAEPTDSGSPWESDTWIAEVTATDASSSSHSATSSGINLNTLRALSVTSSISYGNLMVNENTGDTNSEVTVTNTGNAAIDFELSGTDMCTDYPTCSEDILAVGNQEYALSNFSYGNGTSLSTSPLQIEADLSKPTTSPSDITDLVYWGIGIPEGSATGGYSGENTFSAVTD